MNLSWCSLLQRNLSTGFSHCVPAWPETGYTEEQRHWDCLLYLDQFENDESFPCACRQEDGHVATVSSQTKQLLLVGSEGDDLVRGVRIRRQRRVAERRGVVAQDDV